MGHFNKHKDLISEKGNYYMVLFSNTFFLAFRTFWYKINQCGDGGVLQQPQFSTLLQSTLWPFLLLLPFVHMIVTACGLCFSAWKNNAVSSWNLLFGWYYCKKPVCWVFCNIRIFFPYPNVEKLQISHLMKQIRSTLKNKTCVT